MLLTRFPLCQHLKVPVPSSARQQHISFSRSNGHISMMDSAQLANEWRCDLRLFGKRHSAISLFFFFVNNTCTLASLLLAGHKENNDCRHKNDLAENILSGRLKSFGLEMMNCETNMVIIFLLPLAALLPMNFCKYRGFFFLNVFMCAAFILPYLVFCALYLHCMFFFCCFLSVCESRETFQNSIMLSY